jgi:hypothetical protein
MEKQTITMEQLNALIADLWRDEPVECFLMCQADPDKCGDSQREYALATFLVRILGKHMKYLPLAYTATDTCGWLALYDLAGDYDITLPDYHFVLSNEVKYKDWWHLFKEAGKNVNVSYEEIACWAADKKYLDPVDYMQEDWGDPQFLTAGLVTYLLKHLRNREEKK